MGYVFTLCFFGLSTIIIRFGHQDDHDSATQDDHDSDTHSIASSKRKSYISRFEYETLADLCSVLKVGLKVVAGCTNVGWYGRPSLGLGLAIR